jgi:hypothetical protein
LVLAPRPQQPGALELCEMRRQSGGGHLQPQRDLPGRDALRALVEQQAKHAEAEIVRERGESFGTHVSEFPEIAKLSQSRPRLAVAVAAGG